MKIDIFTPATDAPAPRFCVHDCSTKTMYLYGDSSPWGVQVEGYTTLDEATAARDVAQREGEADLERRRAADDLRGDTDVCYRVVEYTYRGTSEVGRWEPARYVDGTVG